MITVRHGAREAAIPAGSSVQAALEALRIDLQGVLAALSAQGVAELSEALTEGGELIPLTLKNEEGRRIYERSLCLVALTALEELFPGCRPRFEYSVSGGVFLHIPGQPLTAEDIPHLGDRMRAVIQADLPFRQETVTREEAIAVFERAGQPDKVALLKLRSLPTFTLYRCGDSAVRSYFYGKMAPSTGAVRVFTLVPLDDGVVLQLPDGSAPDRPAPYLNRPKHMQAFSLSTKWCGILGVRNVADLAEMQRRHELRQFIRVNEALHEQALGLTAREILQKNRRVVLIAGPSSSGKTTFAGRLGVQLQVMGRRAYRLSLDDYFLNRDSLTPEPDGSLDLESVHILDLPLVQQQVNALLRGETVETPSFNFRTGRRERGKTLRLDPTDLLVIEGIHALNPLLSEDIPAEAIYRIFVSALTCINLDDHNRVRTTDVRLLRRIVRDYNNRGTLPAQTLEMWASVRRGESKWIFPYQEQADLVFNTALHYELMVLKHYAYDLLHAPEVSPEARMLAVGLRKLLHYVPEMDPEIYDEIPPLSLLREFIGGGTMEKA